MTWFVQTIGFLLSYRQTYCDLHMINIQKIKEILEFYKAFAQTFARNLVLTFDLSKRTVFYWITDKHLEKLLANLD